MEGSCRRICLAAVRARLHLLVLGLAALAVLAAASRADAATAFGLTTTNQIVTFDTEHAGVADLGRDHHRPAAGRERAGHRPPPGDRPDLPPREQQPALCAEPGDRHRGRGGRSVHAGPVGRHVRLRLQPGRRSHPRGQQHGPEPPPESRHRRGRRRRHRAQPGRPERRRLGVQQQRRRRDDHDALRHRRDDRSAVRSRTRPNSGTLAPVGAARRGHVRRRRLRHQRQRQPRLRHRDGRRRPAGSSRST